MASIEAPSDTNDPVVTFREFNGLRNVVDEVYFEPGDLAEAENVYINDAKRVARRGGYILQLAGSDVHSLWSNGINAFFVAGAGFYRLNLDYTATQLGYGLTAGARMAYLMVNGTVFHSNGVQLAAYRDGGIHTWGLTNPTAPLASAISGLLPAGTYQYAVTFERADGFESGSSDAMIVELEDSQGIQFTALPVSQNPDVVKVNIYLTPQNGDMLYRIASVDNGIQTYTYVSNAMDLLKPLRTQFKTRPVAGTDLALYNGRIYCVRADYVYYTLSQNYELMDLREYLRFNSPVQIFAPVRDGIFVATLTETIFLRGDEPGKLKYEVIAEYGGVAGTLAYDSDNTDRGVDRIAYWESTSGKVKGMTGGVLINLTDERYTYTPGGKGASIVMDYRGTKQFVSVMQN